MITPANLIQLWKNREIENGMEVKVRGAFAIVGMRECWLPSKPVDEKEWDGSPMRKSSIQIIGDCSDLVRGLFPFSILTHPDYEEVHLFYNLKDVEIEGIVCSPTILDYPLALNNIKSLVVYDDMEDEGVPSTLGDEEKWRPYFLRMLDNGKLRLEWEDEGK